MPLSKIVDLNDSYLHHEQYKLLKCSFMVSFDDTKYDDLTKKRVI